MRGASTKPGAFHGTQKFHQKRGPKMGFYPNQGGQYRELAGLGRGAAEDFRVVVHRGFNMFLTMKIGRYKWIQHYTTGKCWLRIPLGIRH